MEKIQIFVQGNLATVFNSVILTSGTIGQKCEFTFDEAWDNLTKTITFKVGNKKYTIVDAQNGVLTVPAEAMNQPNMLLEIGAQGFSADGALEITTNYAAVGPIMLGADITDDIINPSLEVWQQILVIAKNAEQTAEEAKEIVDNFINITVVDGGDLDEITQLNH